MRLTDGDREVLAEQERDARDLADVTTEVEAAEVEEAYLDACAEAASAAAQWRCPYCGNAMRYNHRGCLTLKTPGETR